MAWTAGVAGPFCNPYQGDVDDVGAFMSLEHGGAFGASTALGPAAFPQQSQVRGVASGGDTIAIGLQLDHQGGVRCGGPGLQDDTADTTVTLATDVPGGLAFAGPHGLGAARARPAVGLADRRRAGVREYADRLVPRGLRGHGCGGRRHDHHAGRHEAGHVAPRWSRSSRSCRAI